MDMEGIGITEFSLADNKTNVAGKIEIIRTSIGNPTLMNESTATFRAFLAN